MNFFARFALLGFCYIIALVMVLGTIAADPLSAPIQLSNLVAQTVLLILALRFPSRWLFTPYELLFYVYFIFNVTRAVALFPHSVLGTEHAYLGFVSYQDYAYGAAMFAVGCTCLLFGSLVPLKLPVFQPQGYTARRFAPTDAVLITMVVILLALLAAVVVQSGDLVLSGKRSFSDESGVTTRFGPIRFALNIAYIYVTLYAFRAAVIGRFGYLAMLAVGVGILVSVVISLRVFALISVLPVIFLLLRHASIRSILLSLLLAPILIFAVAFTSTQRNSASAGKELGPAETASVFVQSVTLSANFGGFVASGISTRPLEPRLEPFYGSTIVLDPVLQLVPRTVYPDKPEELGGRLRVFQQDIGILPRNIKGGLPPGIFGEFWLNFRWPGVVLLSILLGALIHGLYEQAEASRNPATVAVIMFLFALIVFFGFGGHTARLFLFILQMMLALLAGDLVGRLYSGMFSSNFGPEQRAGAGR